MTLTGSPRGRRALVLGGGGAYGIVQAAYIRAAVEAGYRPDLVVGTSVGALNGAWVAIHPDEPDGLMEIWRGLPSFRVLPLNPFRLATRLARGPRAVRDNDLVTFLIESHIGPLKFEDTRLELAVVATNLTRGRKHVFREGPLGQALAASTAIPGVFEPVDIAGELFVDGCITASVDIATAIQAGATEVLAIDLTPPPANGSRPRTALGVLSQSFRVLTHATTEAMEAIAGQAATVRVVRPDLVGLSPWTFTAREGLVERYLAAARAELSGIVDPLGRLTVAVEPAPT
ncbi:MAG TPA: patatin-like phospholipase family protein, partial [Tepidiformaceae bacterium]|nr:patatin-like phospholipase family protein [Tepidiformaceae bacterium]